MDESKDPQPYFTVLDESKLTKDQGSHKYFLYHEVLYRKPFNSFLIVWGGKLSHATKKLVKSACVFTKDPRPNCSQLLSYYINIDSIKNIPD